MKRTAFLALFFILSGCGGPKGKDHPVTGSQPDGTPKWVHRGSGAFDTDDGGKAFFGVGIASGIKNEALARQTSDDRGRGQLARMFDTYVASMMKDYQRSTTAGDFKSSAEEQDVVAVQKTISEVTLTGVEIRDHWWNPQSGAVYALAVLDMKSMLKSMEQAKELNARIKEYVRRNATKAFRDLDRELLKRRASGK